MHFPTYFVVSVKVLWKYIYKTYMCIFDSKKQMQNIFKWNALCWTNTIIFVFIFESNGQFMSYKFVSAQINQLILFSKKTTKNRQVQIWSNLINSDQFWSNLIKSDQNLFLIKFDQIWSNLIRFDLTYIFYFFLKKIFIQWFCSNLKPTGLCCCYFSSGVCLGWD